jgi:putative transposase
LLWSAFKSDFLRLSAPTLTSCYERTAAIAADSGLSMPSERTFRRRLEREIDPRIVTLRRQGEEALRRSQPSQRRTSRTSTRSSTSTSTATSSTCS